MNGAQYLRGDQHSCPVTVYKDNVLSCYCAPAIVLSPEEINRLYLGIYVYIQVHMYMAISEKRDHAFRGGRTGAYGRVCWRKGQAETSSSEYNRKKKQNQTVPAENTLKARAVGQSGERRTLYRVAPQQ